MASRKKMSSFHTAKLSFTTLFPSNSAPAAQNFFATAPEGGVWFPARFE